MWSNVVKETGEPGENHRTWTGDHYPATCRDPDSNPDHSGDKRVRYPLCYPGPLSGFETTASQSGGWCLANHVIIINEPLQEKTNN